MALYSWFNHHHNEPKSNTIKVKRKVSTPPELTRNIVNYTMWPIAEIKKSIETTVLVNDALNSKNKFIIKTNQKKITIDKQFFSFKVPLLINK
jgi:hypothetical protein